MRTRITDAGRPRASLSFRSNSAVRVHCSFFAHRLPARTCVPPSHCLCKDTNAKSSSQRAARAPSVSLWSTACGGGMAGDMAVRVSFRGAVSTFAFDFEVR